MIAVHEYHNIRVAEYAVKNHLLNREYIVARVTEHHGKDTVPFNLIAWQVSGEMTFIRVRSCRKGASKQGFRNEVRDLSTLLQSHRYPGSIHLWIYDDGIWKQYLILLGGAIRIGEFQNARS
nr:hypothetical protein [uncultured Methanospirillum sp.]